MGYILAAVPVLLVLAVLAWFVHRSMDEERIKSHLRQQGGTLLECRYTPLGRDWFTEQTQRVYAVRYRDVDDLQHSATVTTRGLTALHWAEDQVVRYAGEPGGKDALEAENRRLREEVDRLRSQKRDAPP